MTTQSVMTAKQIVVTKADFDRLHALLDSPRYKSAFAASLATLKEELERGRIVATEDIPKNVVTMHAQVVVRDVKSDESETYTLVYPDEADIDEGRLSVLAPLGIALLGTKTGSTVSFTAPAGTRKVKVGKILYQPEAAGDFHL